MQIVRSIGGSITGSVSKTWNSINPATLSGAIDVIVVEQEDGTLACSPFHVRFGKFSLLRPYEKKVEFRVNNEKQDYSMKLGEGGEAFFVFETTDEIPEDLQTSPLVSPASSPPLPPGGESAAELQEPEFLDLSTENGKPIPGSFPRKNSRPGPHVLYSTSVPKDPTSQELLTSLPTAPVYSGIRPKSEDWSGLSLANNDLLPPLDEPSNVLRLHKRSLTPTIPSMDGPTGSYTERSNSPPPLPTKEAVERAMALSQQLAASNIPSHVTDTGDLMLDMNGYKSSEDDALRAEIIARKILSEELAGNYDIGALIGADENGNLWIYSSEEAKEAAARRALLAGLQSSMPPSPLLTSDAASDPGYHSDVDAASPMLLPQRRAESEGLQTPPKTPLNSTTAGDPNRNYAKTLRLTSDQLRSLGLKYGPNPVSFTVNRATCTASMYLWKHDVPVVISDIDGTITKSDALGHVLNMIGRDWTHIGVAKLYTEIVANGFNIMYLTSRSVGQADTTRTYLSGVVQDGYRLPKGPTIMSPDRTIAALRRELYIRKPEVFKMACLRDIKNLFGPGKTPFYAGFGNRLTDALSYRSVNIPSNRIFTINSNAEVSLDLLSLTKLKLDYVSMREIIDHYFPPVNMLIKGGGEEFTDFSYWRDAPLEIDEFSESDSDDLDDNVSDDGDDEQDDEQDDDQDDDQDEEQDDDEDVGEMGDSYMSRDSIDENGDNFFSGSEEEGDELMSSIIEGDENLGDQRTSGPKPTADEQAQVLTDSNLEDGKANEDADAAIITGVHGIEVK